MTRIRDALRDATQRIQATSPSARTDADCLLQHVLEKDRAWLRAHDDEVLSHAQHEAFHAALRRRLAGEPVAYITGQRGFWTIDLQVTPDTLIPRPDTELIVEWALGLIPAGSEMRVLDLGTGTGAIALALKAERPRCHVTAADAAPDTLAVATANARRLALELRCVESDWFSALAGEQFDIVVSNPPYIAADDAHLAQGDLRFEPRRALVADEQGLGDLRRIITAAAGHLQRGGWLLLEHGFEQGEAVRDLFARNGYVDVNTRRDLGGNERTTGGRLPC
jgi:release factor glutamine methyltransferase